MDRERLLSFRQENQRRLCSRETDIRLHKHPTQGTIVAVVAVVVVDVVFVLQPCVQVMMVNPQMCVGYFSVPVPLYDGDTLSSVVDRVKRVSGVPGQSRIATWGCYFQCL